MPDNLNTPNIYITEIPNGVRLISGVPTSIALFVGRTSQGPLDKPVKCLNYSDYDRIYSADATLGELPQQVKLFFSNGGSHCYVIRVDGSAPAGESVQSSEPPQLSDYEKAFSIADQAIDSFNLMVLPRDATPAQPVSFLYGPASVFCQSKRAFLLMDAPVSWIDAQTASHEIDYLRVGLVNDHAALFYPDVTINDHGQDKNIGPSGAIAGLMARIDKSRGVWVAPAGTTRPLRGIIGLQHEFSDSENDAMSARGINTLRRFPDGIVNWGARTMDEYNSFGSEYKYIPVRRLALYLEESVDRGLQWIVFEPNDEPLWAQIRMNVSAFMNGLYRKGAFQGTNPKNAYFVKCDNETTTQADRDSGIVNIVLGFAPIKPAEFVVLSLRQVVGLLPKQLECTASWEELDIPKTARQNLQELAEHMKHVTIAEPLDHCARNASGNATIAIFTGLPGKNKTLPALVLANDLNLPLYQVDLGSLMNEYIGETEKNLKPVFNAATEKGAILFFDEADALFGKRSKVKDSHDLYANAKANHLLRHMKTFQGLIVLSSDTMSTVDPSLLAHFDFVIEFSDSVESQTTF